MAAVKELKLVLWNIPESAKPKGPTDVAALNVDYTNPELFEHLGDQWQVVSHNVTANGDGSLLFSLFLERPIPAGGIDQVGG
jgi:hypothetical protein